MSLVVGRPEFAGDWGDPTVFEQDFPYLIFHFSFSILGHGHDVTGLQWQNEKFEMKNGKSSFIQRVPTR